MNILHTADLHLRQDDEQTIGALEELLTTARDQAVDLLTIGGDLFDSPDDAEALRPTLREYFSGNPFEVVVIPGNHDKSVYRDNLRFGNDLRILTETPCEAVTYGDVQIVGVPFTGSMTEELYSALQTPNDSDVQLLLLHCTLDVGVQSSAVGSGEGRYFPVTRATLADLDYDFVLAGHVHSTVREIPLGSSGRFIYPGSPISHASSEEGPRHAVAIDTTDETVMTVPLETFYYDSYSATMQPGTQQDVLNEIQTWVGQRQGDTCELSVTVDGFIEGDEDEFYAALCEAASPVTPVDQTRSVSRVLEHPLYQRFTEQLAEREDIEDHEAVESRMLEVLARLLARNEVRPA